MRNLSQGRPNSFVGSIFFVIGVFATTSSAAQPSLRRHTLLDSDWLFHRGDLNLSDAAFSLEYVDRNWRHVDLPHDYVIEEAYSQRAPAGHGYLPLEPAWYRKHFLVPTSDRGRILRLDFEGVYRDCEVWVNGRSLAKHQSGYTPFSVDISGAVRFGEDNVVAVRVDPRVSEGWFYEGGGIYRHVWLTSLAPLHIKPWGVYVTAKVPGGEYGARDRAELAISTVVENRGASPAKCSVVSAVLNSDGGTVQTITSSASVPAGGQIEISQATTIPHPRLWSISLPQLYKLRTTIFDGDQTTDESTIIFGIRTISFDAKKGFFLNGQHVKIQGAGCHQDMAGLGIAVPDSLQDWRVAQLKKIGCNAWRTAHNPPNEALLDACDRLGMLVMDENRHLGDNYKGNSRSGVAYSDLSDLATLIQRDRNHPSIVMWSMCNEENLQGTPEGAKIFSAMMNVVHRYDRSRPITCAMSNSWSKPGFADVEDLLAVNGHCDLYDDMHRSHPDKPLLATEDAHIKATRGAYTDDAVHGWKSSYNLDEVGWVPVAERPFVAGSFIWTGFDYKGEPKPFRWPDVSNHTGLLDSAGFVKDKGYYFESCWSAAPMVHLLPMSWNWAGKEGQPIRVIAFSNARKVELLLNEQSLGTQDVPAGSHAEWRVPYRPGQLLAKASTDGKVVATEKLETAGPAARIELTTDRTTLVADGEDAVVAQVSIVDAEGHPVPDADNLVQFQLSGGGRILGVGNGNPSDHDPDKSDKRSAFHAHCMAVIQADSRPEELRLIASSPGLRPSSLEFQAR